MGHKGMPALVAEAATPRCAAENRRVLCVAGKAAVGIGRPLSCNCPTTKSWWRRPAICHSQLRRFRIAERHHLRSEQTYGIKRRCHWYIFASRYLPACKFLASRTHQLWSYPAKQKRLVKTRHQISASLQLSPSSWGLASSWLSTRQRS